MEHIFDILKKKENIYTSLECMFGSPMKEAMRVFPGNICLRFSQKAKALVLRAHMVDLVGSMRGYQTNVPQKQYVTDLKKYDMIGSRLFSFHLSYNDPEEFPPDDISYVIFGGYNPE